MEEIWRPVAGYEGFYEVSSKGRIRSITHITNGRTFKGRGELNPYTKKGTLYQRVALSKVWQKKYYVHDIVAKAFPEICGEWFEGASVDHINGIQNDNRAENLKVCSMSSNIHNPITYQRHIAASVANLKKTRNKESVEKMKRTKSKAVKCVETGVSYWSRLAASEETGANPDSIWQCCAGKKNTAGGLHWVFA